MDRIKSSLTPADDQILASRLELGTSFTITELVRALLPLVLNRRMASRTHCLLGGAILLFLASLADAQVRQPLGAPCTILGLLALCHEYG
jgi:hypothetical protein